MNAEQLRLLGQIEAFDLSQVREVVQRVDGLSDEEARAAETEAKRFLAIVALNPGETFGIVNNGADLFWHTFVLDSPLYRAFCREVAGGFIDHIPKLVVPSEVEGRYSRTLEVYAQTFGTPDAAHWPTNPTEFHHRWCAWCDATLVRDNN